MSEASSLARRASLPEVGECLIAPSILSADFARLGDEVRQLEASGAHWVHFDVMDNHYVPNLSVGPMVCSAIRPHVSLPIDVHLMVQGPDRLIGDFAKAGADIISVHPETTLHLDRTLQLIKGAGCFAGVVLNPATPLNVLDHVLDQIDLILLMSVNPGFGGQKFLPSVLPKLAAVRERIDQHIDGGGQSIRLQVDGGINKETIRDAARAGADTFVAGSAVFSAGSADDGYQSIVSALHQEAQDAWA